MLGLYAVLIILALLGIALLVPYRDPDKSKKDAHRRLYAEGLFNGLRWIVKGDWDFREGPVVTVHFPDISLRGPLLIARRASFHPYGPIEAFVLSDQFQAFWTVYGGSHGLELAQRLSHRTEAAFLALSPAVAERISVEAGQSGVLVCFGGLADPQILDQLQAVAQALVADLAPVGD